MLKLRGEFDLEQKSLRADRGRELRMQHLERYQAIVLQVACKVDPGHATSAELALDLIAITQRFGEGRCQCHTGLSEVSLNVSCGSGDRQRVAR
jgi:hypothetical protein